MRPAQRPVAARDRQARRATRAAAASTKADRHLSPAVVPGDVSPSSLHSELESRVAVNAHRDGVPLFGRAAFLRTGRSTGAHSLGQDWPQAIGEAGRAAILTQASTTAAWMPRCVGAEAAQYRGRRRLQPDASRRSGRSVRPWRGPQNGPVFIRMCTLERCRSQSPPAKPKAMGAPDRATRSASRGRWRAGGR
jgi:hypothetical protein